MAVNRRPTVLVTGAAGFIAGQLVPLLLGAGCRVVALDDLSAGTRWRLPDHDALTLVELDVRRTAELARVVSGARPDTVVHLAARHMIPYCAAHPEETVAVNCDGTRSLLTALGTLPARIVFASTAAVYAPSTRPARETDPVAPIEVYGRSKLAGEALLGTHARRSNGAVTVRICRLFNVFGPHDTNPHLVPDLLHRLRRSDEVEIGNADTRRDYVPVTDAAAVLAELALRQTAPGVLNVGSGTARAAGEVVAELARLTGRPLHAVPVAARRRSGERSVSLADVSLLRRTFPGLRPTPFTDGLRAALTEPAGERR